MKQFDAKKYLENLSPQMQDNIRHCKSAKEIEALLAEKSGSEGVIELSEQSLDNVTGGRGFVPLAMAAMMLFSMTAPLAANAAEGAASYNDDFEPDSTAPEETNETESSSEEVTETESSSEEVTETESSSEEVTQTENTAANDTADEETSEVVTVTDYDMAIEDTLPLMAYNISVHSYGALNNVGGGAGDVVSSGFSVIAKNAFGFVGRTLLTTTISKLAGLGLDPLFKLVFGLDNGPSNQDVIDEVDKVGEKLSKKMDVILDYISQLSNQSAQYHSEEMNYLQLINSNIESKDFRQQADCIKRDNAECISVINRYHKGFNSADDAVIDDITYKYYKKVLSSSSCDMDGMKRNFDNMVAFINGEQYSNNMVRGYDGLTAYLHDKAVAADKSAEWKNAVDYNAVWDGIESEIRSMECDLLTHYYLCLTLSYMQYKVDEYELGDTRTEEALDNIAFEHEQYIEDLTAELTKANERFTKVLQQNEEARKREIVCTVTLSNGQTKGVRSIAEAWSCAVTCGTDCTISYQPKDRFDFIDISLLYRDNLNGVSKSGDGVFVNESGHHITFNTNGVTMRGRGNLFVVGSNSGITLNCGWINGCDTIVRVKKDAKNVNVSIGYCTIEHYYASPIVIESGATGTLSVGTDFKYPEGKLNYDTFVPAISNSSKDIQTPSVSVLERDEDNPEYSPWGT